MPRPPVVYTEIPRLERDILTGLSAHAVATIFEALGPAVGARQTMAGGMVRRTTRRHVVGPAVTADAAGANDNLMAHVALRLAQPGDIVVVAGTPVGAQWGELMATRASLRGLLGAVVDGAVRDIDQVDALDFPVWATAVSPARAEKEAIGRVNQPVLCAGVVVEPGDIVVADGDGVIVIPFAQARAVLERADARVSAETRIIDDARAGLPSAVDDGRYAQALATLEVREQTWMSDNDRGRGPGFDPDRGRGRRWKGRP